MRETLAEELAMRRIVQPARCAAWMRQRNERHAIDHARTADGSFERDLPPEPVDRETPEKQDDSRPENRQLLIEPRNAQRDLRRRRPAIAASGRRLPGKAFRDRGAIRQMVFVDAGLGEPAPELRAGTAAERLPRGELDRTRRLPDDRDAVPNGSGDDRASALEEARVDALRARANARVKPSEDVTVSGSDANDACQLVDYRSGCRDSNPGPPEPHSGTLPGCATPRT